MFPGSGTGFVDGQRRVLAESVSLKKERKVHLELLIDLWGKKLLGPATATVPHL